ncbi:MAG: divalent-cation tolerance protein CutA [Pyrinomonadaceae bacterium]
MLIVLTSVATPEDGEGLAEKLVGERLAACVQVLPAARSVYVWDGEIKKETETLLLIKTTEDRFGPLERFLRANHPYEVPEIVAVRPEHVSGSYAAWLAGFLT